MTKQDAWKIAQQQQKIQLFQFVHTDVYKIDEAKAACQRNKTLFITNMIAEEMQNCCRERRALNC